MKKAATIIKGTRTVLFMAILSMIWIVSGCKKKDSNNTTDDCGSDPQGSMSATVNGSSFSATWTVGTSTCNYTMAVYPYINANQLYMFGYHYNYVNGTWSNWQSVVLYVNNVTGAGTFTLGGSSANSGNIGYYYDYPTTGSSNAKMYYTDTVPSFSGTVTISKLDAATKKISGTFSFTAKQEASQGSGTVTVTNGSFTDVKY